jgi:hypothetical protein
MTRDKYINLIVQWFDFIGFPENKLIGSELSDRGIHDDITSDSLRESLRFISGENNLDELSEIYEKCINKFDIRDVDISVEPITSLGNVTSKNLSKQLDFVNYDNKVYFLFDQNSGDGKFRFKQPDDSCWMRSNNLTLIKAFIKANWTA